MRTFLAKDADLLSNMKEPTITNRANLVMKALTNPKRTNRSVGHVFIDCSLGVGHYDDLVVAAEESGQIRLR